LRRSASAALWHANGALLEIANKLESVANATNSKLLLQLWGRIAADAYYWESVRSTGCTLEQIRHAAGRERIALMLHSIADPLSPAEKSYYIAPRRFSNFMQRFVSSGYKTTTLHDWLQNAVLPRHVLLTFDDAYDDLYEHLLPLVIEHHLTPVIFVVADRIGQTNLWDQASGLRSRNLLNLSQLREMQRYGVLFGSHTLSHAALPTTSDQQLLRETRDSRLKLQDLLGSEILSFAYPYGEVDQRVRSAVVAAGYKVAFTTLPGPNWWNDPFSQRRADINEYTSSGDFSFSLRRGQRRAQSISSTLRTLEQSLPTSALRSLAHGMRLFARRLYLGASGEPDRRT
jgi:peptidoglycan/xylan/chitin deacetylase (PgdA/CDA1 family)